MKVSSSDCEDDERAAQNGKSGTQNGCSAIIVVDRCRRQFLRANRGQKKPDLPLELSL